MGIAITVIVCACRLTYWQDCNVLIIVGICMCIASVFSKDDKIVQIHIPRVYLAC